MFSTRTLVLASLLAASTLATAAPRAPAAADAVLLEAVIVTPTARYSASEWQARQHAVMLDTVVVTPRARYTLAQWQQRQSQLAYVKQQARQRGIRAWLKTVWKRFEFVSRQIEA